MTNNQDHAVNTEPTNFKIEVYNSYYRIGEGTGPFAVERLGIMSSQSWRLYFDISKNEVPLKLIYGCVGEREVEVSLT